MSKISILHEDEGINKIVSIMYNNLLIPIFGSGITFGSSAKKYSVPNGDEATEIMKKLIYNYRPDLKKDISDANFNSTSDFFYKCVPEEARKDFFRDYFTSVIMEGERKEIINFEWPYAYTINIDDGIESNSNFNAVYPYNRIKRPNTEVKLLYKLHGDAYNEVIYDSKENIAFSYKQYINVLRNPENKDF
ncbi:MULTISPECIES: hypothetical protein [unclassified Desulfovibrio]|uniref:hypothetical protein n=1 Tax=unclassified Desulfovibrio TaxID=2593640 RepID=UPI0013EB84E9|nr:MULTISPECIES: hypothetical protein [unclassified Desulfovibrio]